MIDCPLCEFKILKSKDSNPHLYNGKLYYHCTHCDLFFLDPNYHLSVEEEKARYLKHENNNSDTSYQDYLKEGVSFAVPFLKSKGRVLDFGSGCTNVASELFKTFGFEAQSYDPFFFPDLPRGKFDGIFANEVVEHLHSPKDVFKDMVGLLNSNGCLILRTKLHYPGLNFQNWWYLRDSTHIVFYSKKTIEWICGKFKLKLLAQEGDLICLQKNENS